LVSRNNKSKREGQPAIENQVTITCTKTILSQ